MSLNYLENVAVDYALMTTHLLRPKDWKEYLYILEKQLDTWMTRGKFGMYCTDDPKTCWCIEGCRKRSKKEVSGIVYGL